MKQLQKSRLKNEKKYQRTHMDIIKQQREKNKSGYHPYNDSSDSGSSSDFMQDGLM